MTAKELIKERLDGSGWLAVHKLLITGVSDNAAATRLSEMAREGIVESRIRAGKHFKEWRLKHDDKPQSIRYDFDQSGQGAFI